MVSENTARTLEGEGCLSTGVNDVSVSHPKFQCVGVKV